MIKNHLAVVADGNDIRADVARWKQNDNMCVISFASEGY